VIDRKDKKGEKYLCAYLTGIEGRNKIPGVLELKESLSKVLPDSMIPSYFVPMEKLPLTSNGKIDRKALPEPTYSIRDIPYISEEMLKQLQLKSKAEH
jgi:bacitracin synthase 3